MAQLALGVVGAVVGGFIAPGIGAAIGWSVGSALGGFLDPPHVEGPRLGDLKQQGSAYGSFIGIPYGTMRMAGDVIWQTDIKEHSHTEGGGKGGGPEVTTYNYTCSFAIQVCEGPISSIRRIWADSRLIWDQSPGATPVDLPLVIYLGGEAQLPDPTMEAVEGAGNVPAHRGTAYVVFTDLELADYGNRVPSFAFEVLTRSIESLDAPLATIVSDISERCGAASYDVSQLTDTVPGYLIGSQMPGRSAIEPLMSIYFFDAVESDGVVKFVKRGADPAITIDDEELAAVNYGGNLPEPFEVTRANESQLPSVVSLTYLNPAADYQTNTQTQRRQSGITNVTLQAAVAISDDKAKQVVDALLFHPWLERDRRSFRTTRKYLAIEPTDIVTVAGRDLRITQKSELADGVLKFDALPSLQSLYVQPAISGSAGGFVPPVIPSSQPADLLLLDLPLVDDDDDAGFYAAMAGSESDSWRGGVLYQSSDGGSTYAEVARTSVADVMGTVSDILADYRSGDIFDEANTITVVIGLGGGTLSSITELAVLNGGNKALVGSEIIQYRDAVLTGPSTYVLSGLLRGRRGTEWAIGTHGSDERFVVLPTTMNIASTQLNVSKLYKAVTRGRTLASVSPVTFANTGAALRPYAVVHAGGGFDAAGNCVMQWVRRARIGGDWIGYVDVPLSEDQELYQVEIWDSTFTDLKRTITGITSPGATYTAAEQSSDFGSTQATVYAKVYQLGRVPSRGVRCRFPNNIVTWTADLEPTPGPVPPLAALRTIPFMWSAPGQTLQAYSSDYGGFSASDSISVSFTTPAGTSSNVGRISLVEFVDAPVERVACMSLTSGDFESGLTGQPFSKQTGIGIAFRFTVGVAVPYALLLAPSTTYYMNLRNGITSYESCNIQITLQKPSGL